MPATGAPVCNNWAMPRFVLIEVPYHMGLEDAGVGRGPARLLRAGADRALAEAWPDHDGCPAVLHHVREAIVRRL